MTAPGGEGSFDLARVVAGFAGALRRAGLSVPTGSVLGFADALRLVGLENPERLYFAGLTTLIRRPEDFATYSRVFAAFWAGVVAAGSPPLVADQVALVVDDDDGDDSAAVDEQTESGQETKTLRWSAVEVLKQRDMATLSEAEWVEADRLIAAMRATSDLRPSRRTRAARRRGKRPDLRATVRRNIRNGGTPIHRAFREAVDRPRRMVFLLDVSGSMESYSRAMARFAHAAASSRRAGGVEVFTIGTRLSRVTREMRLRDPEAALHDVASSVADWSGGTRLGESLREFNQRWGVRGMARGAVVVICSDGWDRGDPEVMDAQMGRLSRVAHRVVWVNPLKATPGYAPLARGMAAALPHVDVFVEGHSVSSLEELARIVVGPARTLGRASGPIQGVRSQ